MARVHQAARRGGGVAACGSSAAGEDEVVAKRMQLLRELAPEAKRIALLINPTDPENAEIPRTVDAAGGGQQLLVREWEIVAHNSLAILTSAMIFSRARARWASRQANDAPA